MGAMLGRTARVKLEGFLLSSFCTRTDFMKGNHFCTLSTCQDVCVQNATPLALPFVGMLVAAFELYGSAMMQ